MQYILLIYGAEPTEAVPEDLMAAELDGYGAANEPLVLFRSVYVVAARQHCNSSQSHNHFCLEHSRKPPSGRPES